MEFLRKTKRRKRNDDTEYDGKGHDEVIIPTPSIDSVLQNLATNLLATATASLDNESDQEQSTSSSVNSQSVSKLAASRKRCIVRVFGNKPKSIKKTDKVPVPVGPSPCSNGREAPAKAHSDDVSISKQPRNLPDMLRNNLAGPSTSTATSTNTYDRILTKTQLQPSRGRVKSSATMLAGLLPRSRRIPLEYGRFLEQPPNRVVVKRTDNNNCNFDSNAIADCLVASLSNPNDAHTPSIPQEEIVSQNHTAESQPLNEEVVTLDEDDAAESGAGDEATPFCKNCNSEIPFIMKSIDRLEAIVDSMINAVKNELRG